MFQIAYSNRFIVCVVLLLVSACSDTKPVNTLPYYNSPDFTPLFFNDAKEALAKVDHTIAPFSFTTEQGQAFTDENIKGKIHIASFIFTSCGSICPVMTSRLQEVSQRFEKDSNVVLLSYTVTPWVDTPAQLLAYKRAKQINNPNWHFLTGDKASIYSLARTSYFAEEDLGFTRDSSEFLHTEHVILVDASKRIRGIYNGTLKLEIKQLIEDITTLKAEPGL